MSKIYQIAFIFVLYTLSLQANTVEKPRLITQRNVVRFSEDKIVGNANTFINQKPFQTLLNKVVLAHNKSIRVKIYKKNKVSSEKYSITNVETSCFFTLIIPVGISFSFVDALKRKPNGVRGSPLSLV